MVEPFFRLQPQTGGIFFDGYDQLGGSPELTESSRTNLRFPMRTYLSRPARRLRHTVDGSTPYSRANFVIGNAFGSIAGACGAAGLTAIL